MSADYSLLEKAFQVHQAGRWQEARLLYQQVLSRDPQEADAWHGLGVLALQTGQHREALHCLRQAVSAAPDVAAIQSNLGHACYACGDALAALAAFEKAVALDNRLGDAWINLGNVYLELGRLEQAEASYLRAIELPTELQTALPEAHTNLGKLYLKERRTQQAITELQRALSLRPQHYSALLNLGNAYKEIGQADLAIEQYQKARQVRPQAMEAWSNLLFTMNYAPRYSAAQIYSAHVEFGQSLQSSYRAPVIRRGEKRRLHIGYVSADLRMHALSRFLEPVLRQHDRQRFAVHCYYNSRVGDAVTARIESYCDRFTMIAGRSDQELNELIKQHDIDILVDLSGHSADNRLALFASKAAPVQVSWLGYLGTTGLKSIDYRLTDSYADAREITDSYHTEQLWRLPHTMWCYEPWPDTPQVLDRPADSAMTFVSMNNPAKLNLEVIQLWARLLHQVPASHIRLYTPLDEQYRATLLSHFTALGVAATRLQFIGRLAISDYLNGYNQVDIALDSFPYSGGTTSCDALCMGVPTVTLQGDRPFSGSAASVLSNVGLHDWIAKTPEQYLNIALAWAERGEVLRHLRKELRSRLLNSPLGNSAQFTHELENAYTAMWHRYLDRS